MPQLIFLALLVAGGYFVVKAVRREMARVDRELRETRDEKTAKPTATLEKDPETGRYRPKQE